MFSFLDDKIETVSGAPLRMITPKMSEVKSKAIPLTGLDN
jgi:hypothetical protein